MVTSYHLRLLAVIFPSISQHCFGGDNAVLALHRDHDASQTARDTARNEVNHEIRSVASSIVAQ